MQSSALERPERLAGLANGVLLRTQVDRITGQLSDTRTRFLGTRPPKLFAADVKGQRSMLSLSSRPWLGYSDMGRYNLTPLSYEALDYASGMPPILLPSMLGAFCFHIEQLLLIISHTNWQQSQHLTGYVSFAAI